MNLQREPSPPIPTLQKKQTNFVASRSSSALSQLSSRTVSHLVTDANVFSHHSCYDVNLKN